MSDRILEELSHAELGRRLRSLHLPCPKRKKQRLESLQRHREHSSRDVNGKLSDKITCSEDVLQRLNSNTIALCNEIVCGLTEDDPAIVAQVTDSAIIHLVCGLPHSPVAQGANEQASFISFRDWLIMSAHHAPGVSAANQVGGPMSTCWHHLSDEQAHSITIQQWHVLAWAAAIQALQPGEVALVLRMTGTGVGRAHMFVVPQVFG